MVKDFSIIVSAFVLAFLDCFVVGFVPPVSPTIGTALQFSSHIWVMTLICGIMVGLGTSFSLWFFRTIGYKYLKLDKFQQLKIWQLRISVFINHIGYYIIVPFAATSLTMAVAVTFLLADEVNYKKFTFYLTIGRTLILFLFVAGLRMTTGHSYIPFAIMIGVYIITFLALVIVFYRNRQVLIFIREEELLLKEKMIAEGTYKEPKFMKKIKGLKRRKK